MLYTLKDLIKYAASNSANTENGWVPARPIGNTLKQRIKSAWKVLTGEADAVIWPGDQ